MRNKKLFDPATSIVLLSVLDLLKCIRNLTLLKWELIKSKLKSVGGFRSAFACTILSFQNPPPPLLSEVKRSVLSHVRNRHTEPRDKLFLTAKCWIQVARVVGLHCCLQVKCHLKENRNVRRQNSDNCCENCLLWHYNIELI